MDTTEQKPRRSANEPAPARQHPLEPLSGRYEGETWEGLLEEMARNRDALEKEALDTQEAVVE